MKKRKLILILTATAGLITAAHARNGETLEQCVARYGQVAGFEKSASGLPEMTQFRKGEWLIKVHFLNGKAVITQYAKAQGTELNEDEIQNFLDIEGGNWKDKWLPPSAAEMGAEPRPEDPKNALPTCINPNNHGWSNAAGGYASAYQKDAPPVYAMTFFTKEGLQELKEQELESQKGF